MKQSQKHARTERATRGALPFGLALALTAALAGCGSRLVGTDPQLSRAERDNVQRQMSRPPLERDASFESTSVTREIAVPFETFSNWFRKTGAPELGTFLTGTPKVPGVERTELITASWDRPGSRRRVLYSDGNSGVEELVVDNLPRLYQYQAWNLTNDTGRYIRYGVGQFQLRQTALGTRVVWTYFFRPKVWPDGLFIRSSVHEDYRAFMSKGLEAMAARALADSQRH